MAPHRTLQLVAHASRPIAPETVTARRTGTASRGDGEAQGEDSGRRIGRGRVALTYLWEVSDVALQAVASVRCRSSSRQSTLLYRRQTYTVAPTAISSCNLSKNRAGRAKASSAIQIFLTKSDGQPLKKKCGYRSLTVCFQIIKVFGEHQPQFRSASAMVARQTSNLKAVGSSPT